VIGKGANRIEGFAEDKPKLVLRKKENRAIIKIRRIEK